MENLLIGIKAHMLTAGLAVGGPLAAALAFMLAGRSVPGLIVAKLARVFNEAKTSLWWRNPDKPHRARFLLAAAVFLEAEVPNPGEGQHIYDAFGAWANRHARIGGIPFGSAAQWAALGRKGGDAIDLQLDAEIVELATLNATPTDS